MNSIREINGKNFLSFNLNFKIFKNKSLAYTLVARHSFALLKK